MPTSPTANSNTRTSRNPKRTAAAKTLPRRRSHPAADGSTALRGSPASAETVTKRKPRARNSGISRATAATVSLRLPPPSCSITIPPVTLGGLALWTIFATPGRVQSSES